MSSIPMPIQALLDLFQTSLADVRFADVDAATLTELAAEVEAAAAEVAVAQAALDAARAVMQERQDALLERAHRALAYARVFAESGDEALVAQLATVALPRVIRRARTGEEILTLSTEPPVAPRPRGRPRKNPAVPVANGTSLLDTDLRAASASAAGEQHA